MRDTISHEPGLGECSSVSSCWVLTASHALRPSSRSTIRLGSADTRADGCASSSV